MNLIDSFSRRLFGSSVSMSAARTAAKAEATKRGWPWPDHIRASARPRTFIFRTWSSTPGGRGGGIVIVIDRKTGEVRRAGVLPR